MNTLFSIYNYNDNSEYFAKLVYNNEIIPDYYISNYGRVYSIRWQRFLKQTPDKDGYLRVGIVINGKNKTIKIHRLVLMTFNPIQYPDKYVGNHMHPPITNNNILNLEWATAMDNTRHGWDTGLNNNIGENNVRTYLKECDIHRICKLLENGYRLCEICDEFEITDLKERRRFSAIISSIKYNKSYRNISILYDIEGSKGRDRYSLEFAHLVGQFMIDDKSDDEIIEELQISQVDINKFNVYLGDLRRGRTAKSVMQQYGII